MAWTSSLYFLPYIWDQATRSWISKDRATTYGWEPRTAFTGWAAMTAASPYTVILRMTRLRSATMR